RSTRAPSRTRPARWPGSPPGTPAASSCSPSPSPSVAVGDELAAGLAAGDPSSVRRPPRPPSEPHRRPAGGALPGGVEDAEDGDGVAGIDRGRAAGAQRPGQPGVERLVGPGLGLDLAELPVDPEPAPALARLPPPPRLG